MDQPDPVIFRASTFFNPEVRKNNLYWTEYLIPNNCIYSIEGNLALKNNVGLKGGFSFYRGGEKNDFTEGDVTIIKLYQRHLSNVLKYYGDTADSTSILFMLENYNCVGVAILDSRYDIMRSSNTFKNLVNKKQNKINIVGKMRQLAIKLVKSGENSAEYKFEEEAVYLEMTRLPADSKAEGGQFSCLLYDLSHFSNQTLYQAKEKYVLTSREFEIIQAILKGKSNEEIAEELYLSLPTVKKYLASIYSKMEIKNQKQIFDKLKLI